ncbi:hypothetical protein Leryth_013959 [Lithospermum erythrorhizon]|nr:hypothetical protein Leryth_013959 [Lithospermum erythrorhizon]
MVRKQMIINQLDKLSDTRPNPSSIFYRLKSLPPFYSLSLSLQKMEALQKLQQIQKIIDLMHSNGLVNQQNAINNSDSDSYRFIANFSLFMLQPCGDLNFTRKCELISEYMPKISDTFLVEAQQRVDNEVTLQFDRCSPSSSIQKEGATPFPCGDNSQPQKTNFEEFAMIGLDAMQRANSTLEDFCRSYFMFHNMDPNEPQSVFRYLPILSFTESYIYQLDTLNEKLLQSPTDGVRMICRDNDMESSISWVHKWTSILINDTFGPLICLIKNFGLLTERIREELDSGKEYWALERKLCGAFMNNEELSVSDVTRAMHLKSFDYRVLNLILYQLRGEKLF